MAAPQMLIRIAANLDELKRNLAEGGQAINTTATNLAKMSSSLQGDALIRKAQEITAAVNNIGGASRLTEAEQARVNATLEKALAKYEALGRKAPQALRELAAQTRAAEQPTSLLHSTVGKLVAGFSAAMIVDRVVAGVGNFAREAFEGAGKVLDLSAKTGLSTKAIQEMEYASKLTGTSLETFTNAAFKLGTNLAGGSESVVASVRALGLSYSELRAQSPDEQFRIIADRLFNVEDAQTRNKLAVDLFGKAAKDILPAIAQGYSDIADAAVVAGDQQLQALDMASDALDTATVAAKNLATQLLGGLVIAAREVWSTFRNTTETALTPFTYAIDRAKDAAAAFGLISVDVPKVQGPASVAIKNTAEQAKALTMSWEDMERLSDSLTPKVEAHGEAHKRVAAAVREAKPAVEANNNLVSRAITDTAKLSKELETWAQRNGAVYLSVKQVNSAMTEQEPLMSRSIAAWDTFKPAVTSSLAGGEAATGSFFDRFKAAFGGGGEGGGDMKQVLGGVTSMFTQAFLGGGGALGAMKGLATQGLGALMSMIPGIGPFIQGLAGPIVEGLSKIGNKIKDFFKNIFGGPSGDELAGRELVGKFETTIQGMLTEGQKLEAGNESWKATVIAIRDAYIAQGLTEQQALRDAERLWQSSKQGAEASKRVIAEIEANMRGAGAAAVDAVNRIGRAIEDLPDRVTIPIDIEGEGPGLPGYRNGSDGIRDFGAGTLAVLHGRERVQTESQMVAEQRSGGGGGADIGAMINRLEAVLPMALRDAIQMAGA